LGSTDAELSVVLVDDREIARLAGDFGRRRRATDVLAFAQREGPGRGDSQWLGDVVVSVAAARRQAAGRGVGMDRELRALLIHGCLHLLGSTTCGAATAPYARPGTPPRVGTRALRVTRGRAP
jgi:rRNA maturation RNase YbeY